MAADEIPAEVAAAVTPERLEAWGLRIDYYADFSASEALADRRRLVFRSLVLAWLMGLSENSTPEVVAVAAGLVRGRLADYDAAHAVPQAAADVPHRRGCVLAPRHLGECQTIGRGVEGGAR
jgi:hypothetical protein